MSVTRRLAGKVRSGGRKLRLGVPPHLAPKPTDVACPVCERTFRSYVAHRGQPQAMCPGCGALARHRVLWSYLTNEGRLDDAGSILHFAPEATIGKRLAALPGRRYVCCDIEPRHDVALDITRLPFDDGAFDLVLCCHVLEHVPNDVEAMRELGRVTRSSGLALVQVPWVPDALTDEAPSASPAERIRRFGQADHVRMYGRDVISRMEEAGLSTAVVGAAELPDYGLIRAPRTEAILVGRPRR